MPTSGIRIGGVQSGSGSILRSKIEKPRRRANGRLTEKRASGRKTRALMYKYDGSRRLLPKDDGGVFGNVHRKSRTTFTRNRPSAYVCVEGGKSRARDLIPSRDTRRTNRKTLSDGWTCPSPVARVSKRAIIHLTNGRITNCTGDSCTPVCVVRAKVYHVLHTYTHPRIMVIIITIIRRRDGVNTITNGVQITRVNDPRAGDV